MDETLLSLRDAFQPDRLPALVQVAKIAFFVLVLWLLLGLVRGRGRDPVTPRFRIHRTFFATLCAVFLGVFVYQGTWQLGGFARPAFVDFMQKYNRRPDNPARRMVRGEIRDRQGIVLARDDADDPTRRVYPLGPAACHVVGYHHPRYGMTGLEAADHPYLEGYSTATAAEREQFRRNLLQSRAPHGNHRTLTLDARLQQEAARLLAGRRGAAVALDPRNGDVLALASAPAFDPNGLAPAVFEEDPDRSPLFNRALQGLYPPGSTFKMVVAALALERGVEPVFDCPGEGYTPARGTRPIRDHEYYDRIRRGQAWAGHGRLSLSRALARSSNVYFAQLGVQLGPLALKAEADRFLFNQTVALFEGSSGTVRFSVGRFPALDERQRGAAAQLAIGQGELLATPMGMALAGAAIANDGRLMRPRLSADAPPELLAGCASPTAARRLRALLREVVTVGTGRAADLSGLAVAGKTGTAQTPRGDDHAWFVCMAPAVRPVLVVCVLVEHGGYGAAAALPVATGLLKKARDIGWFDPAGGGR